MGPSGSGTGRGYLAQVFRSADHVGNLSSILTENNVELYGFTVVHTLVLVLVVPGDRCVVDEYVIAIVVAIDKALAISNVEPSNGPYHWLFSVAARIERAVLHLHILSCGLHILRQGMPVTYLLALGELDNLADLQVIILEAWSVMICLELVHLLEQVQLLLRSRVSGVLLVPSNIFPQEDFLLGPVRTTPKAFSLPCPTLAGGPYSPDLFSRGCDAVRIILLSIMRQVFWTSNALT